MKYYFYVVDAPEDEIFVQGYWDSDNRNFYECSSYSGRTELLGCVCRNGHVIGLPYNSSYEHIPGQAFVIPVALPQKTNQYVIYKIEDRYGDSPVFQVIGYVTRDNGKWNIWKYWERYCGFSLVGNSKVSEVAATAAFLFFQWNSFPEPKEVMCEGRAIPAYDRRNDIRAHIENTLPPAPSYMYPLDLRLIRSQSDNEFYDVHIPGYPSPTKNCIYFNYKKQAKHVLGYFDSISRNYYDRSYSGKETILGSVDLDGWVYNCAYHSALNQYCKECIGYFDKEGYVFRINQSERTQECIGFVTPIDNGYDIMAYIPEQAGHTFVGYCPDSTTAGAAFLLLQKNPMMNFAAMGVYWWHDQYWNHGSAPKSGHPSGYRMIEHY